MTFKNLQDRVMARLNLSSTDARARIKDHLNQRLREAQTSVSLAHTRRTTVSINTVANTATITTTGVIKPITIVIPTYNHVLSARSLDQLRNMDPANGVKGRPDLWALTAMNATSTTVRLFPIPDAIYALQIDGVATGTDMSNDNDVPGLPEDFHDLLIRGALADEYEHSSQADDALQQEARFQTRLKELRYFIAKSTYKHVAQGSPQGASREWWFYGNHVAVE